jgi:hypothetical protein
MIFYVSPIITIPEVPILPTQKRERNQSILLAKHSQRKIARERKNEQENKIHRENPMSTGNPSLLKITLNANRLIIPIKGHTMVE